jgi:hypothetical protein
VFAQGEGCKSAADRTIVDQRRRAGRHSLLLERVKTMLRSTIASLALGAMLVTAAPAMAFTAANGMTVSSDSARSFVVVSSRGKMGATDFWCAAGDFAIRSLRLRPSTRLFRMTPGSGRNGIRFSLDEKGSVPSGVTVFGSKDSGLSASLAQVYCTSMKQDDFFDR